MSFAPYIPHPKRQECLAEAGLPSWYDGDPMLVQPQQALNPEKIKAYNACKKANQNNSPLNQLNNTSPERKLLNSPLNQLNNTSPERKLLYAALAVLVVFSILKVTKVI